MTSAPVVKGPRDIAELRNWLLEQWQPGRVFANHSRAQNLTKRQYEGNNDEWERRTLRGCSLWWVSEEMVDLLLATASSVPDDATMKDVTPPDGQGFVVFAKPWQGIDTIDTERACTVDAMVWGGSHLAPIVDRPDTARRGIIAVSTSSYRHLDFAAGLGVEDMQLAQVTNALSTHGVQLDEVPYEVVKDEDGWNIVRGSDGKDTLHAPGSTEDDPTFVFKAKAEGRQIRTYRYGGHSWCPLGRSDWPVGDRIDAAPWLMSEHMRASFVEDRKVLVALWTLLGQELMTSTRREGVPREARRRAERSGVERGRADNVRIVVLRKVRHGSEGVPDGEHGHYSVRFPVSGHFRHQPYGPNRSLRRLQFIPGYIKGPDNAPFRAPTKVNAWKR